VHTVWLVTFGGRALHAQTDKPQETIGAMRFRGVTAAIVASSLLVPFGFFAFSDARKVELYVPVWPDDGAGLGGWVFALAVPWWAGVLLWPVLPGCLILLAWHMSRLGSVVVRAPLGAPQEERDRAAAIGCYAIAPLAWLLPAAVIWLSLTSALAYLEDIWRRFGLVGDLGIALVACILYLLLALGVLATLWRLGQCARRVRVGRLWITPAAAVECGLLAIVGAVVLLGLLPWAIGFLWLVFDSLR
jgi:hypothetical protein